MFSAAKVIDRESIVYLRRDLPYSRPNLISLIDSKNNKIPQKSIRKSHDIDPYRISRNVKSIIEEYSPNEPLSQFEYYRDISAFAEQKLSSYSISQLDSGDLEDDYDSSYSEASASQESVNAFFNALKKLPPINDYENYPDYQDDDD